ncbi:MAG: hypothetical protein ACE14W_12605 [Candidatus Velamenicoccus archaeovorus]
MESAEPSAADGRGPGALGRPGAHALRMLRDPVVVVLALAGIADVVTGDPAMHGIALVAVAAVLIRDGVRRGVRSAPVEPVAARSRPRFRFTPAVVAGGALYAVLVGWFGRFSWPLTVGVAVPGALAVAAAWRTPAGPAPTPLDPVGKAAWLAVFLSLAAWEVQALLQQPSITTSSWDHPTLSTLMDPILAGHLGRSATMIVWLALGGYLLRLVDR